MLFRSAVFDGLVVEQRERLCFISTVTQKRGGIQNVMQERARRRDLLTSLPSTGPLLTCEGDAPSDKRLRCNVRHGRQYRGGGFRLVRKRG